ncbi:MAG: TolC family protein [Fusobacteria bacterium]|nr:TolC family protein [Fusobacteriota bacterium]
MRKKHIILLGLLISSTIAFSDTVSNLTFEQGLNLLTTGSTQSQLNTITNQQLTLQQSSVYTDQWRTLYLNNQYQRQNNVTFSDPETTTTTLNYSYFYYTYSYSYYFNTIDESQIGITKDLRDVLYYGTTQYNHQTFDITKEQTQNSNQISSINTISSYIDDYTSLTTTKSKIKVINAQVKAQVALVDSMSKQTTTAVSPLDLEKSQLDLENLKNQKSDLENQYQVGISKLCLLLNIPYNQNIEVDSLALSPTPVNCDNVDTYSLQNGQLNIQQAKINSLYDNIQNLPDVNFQYGYDTYYKSWLVSLNVTLNMFSTHATSKEAALQTQATQLTYNDMLKQQQQEIFSLQKEFTQDQSTLKYAKQNNEYYKKYLDVQKDELNRGMISYSDYSKTLSDAVSAEEGYYSALNAVIALQKKLQYGIETLSETNNPNNSISSVGVTNETSSSN